MRTRPESWTWALHWFAAAVTVATVALWFMLAGETEQAWDVARLLGWLPVMVTFFALVAVSQGAPAPRSSGGARLDRFLRR